MTKIRSFIAINLPDEIKKEIGFLIEKLKEKNKSQEIKWVNPEGIHLTLHFLGYLDEEMVKQVKKIIQKCIVGFAPTEIELKDFDSFPNLQRPRVLFISGQETGKNKSLQNLQIKIGRELENIGIKVDRRPWQIHLTLARLKSPIRLSIATPKLSRTNFKVKSIDLMKSELTPQGAIYSLIESFSL